MDFSHFMLRSYWHKINLRGWSWRAESFGVASKSLYFGRNQYSMAKLWDISVQKIVPCVIWHGLNIDDRYLIGNRMDLIGGSFNITVCKAWYWFPKPGSKRNCVANGFLFLTQPRDIIGWLLGGFKACQLLISPVRHFQHASKTPSCFLLGCWLASTKKHTVQKHAKIWKLPM